MLWPSRRRRWCGLPSRLALLLGIGALSASGGQAGGAPTSGEAPPLRMPQQSVADFGALQIWSDGADRVYLSEAGGEAQELLLGDTAEGRILRELLERDGATASRPQVLRHRIILVGGGGDSVPPPAHSSASQAPRSTGGGATAKKPPAPPDHPQGTDHSNATIPSAAQKG